MNAWHFNAWESIVGVMLIGALLIGILFMSLGGPGQKRRAKAVFALAAAATVAMYLLNEGPSVVSGHIAKLAIALLGSLYIVLKLLR